MPIELDPVSGGEDFPSSPLVNAFEFVSVIQPAGASIRVLAIRNISTTGEGTPGAIASTDRGRMYGRAVKDVDNWDITLYANRLRTIGVLSAAGVPVGEAVEMIAAGTAGIHGESGRIVLDAAPDNSDQFDFVIWPTFADDADVYPDWRAVAALPGYDTDADAAEPHPRGLAFFHAKAMRQLMGVSLPANIPNLFGGMGLAAMESGDDDAPPMPDIRKLANVDQLREIQGAITLALAAESQSHQKEFADIAAAAWARVTDMLAELKAANATAEEEAGETLPGNEGGGVVSFGTFMRS